MTNQKGLFYSNTFTLPSRIGCDTKTLKNTKGYMEKTLIFHAGPHKTGSTSLQEFLRLNKKELASQGIDFLREHSLRNVWVTDEPTDFLSTWQPVIDRFNASSKSLIITDETFAEIFSKNPSSVKDLKKHFPDTPIRIIIYLRRQDLHYESFYKTLISGYGHTDQPNVQHILDSPGYKVIPSKNRFQHNPLILHDYDYYGWVTQLEKEVGKENLILRQFEKGKFIGGNLYRDFVDALGLKWSDKFTIPPRNSLKGLSAKATPLCRQFNTIFPINLEQQLFSYFLVYIGEIMGIDKDKTVLSNEERQKVIERFQEGNDLLSKKYFDSRPLFSPLENDSNTNTNGNRELKKEDLEMMMIYLHHFWFEFLGNADLSLLNFIRLYRAKYEKKQGVPGARFRHFVHKTIHSFGKRFVKGWRGDTGELTMALANVFAYIDLAPLKNEYQEKLKVKTKE